MTANPILLQKKYSRVVKLYAETASISYEEALQKFYNSTTYSLISQGIADMHCMSDQYLVQELLQEQI